MKQLVLLNWYADPMLKTKASILLRFSTKNYKSQHEKFCMQNHTSNLYAIS